MLKLSNPFPDLLCEGASDVDLANYTNIFASCFQMRGVPTRTDGGYEGTMEGGSKWSAPLYVCASALKATIKTVTFVSAATAPSVRPNLTALAVESITPKSYPDPASFPVWGIENSSYLLGDAIPLWGLVSPAYANVSADLMTLRQPSIYLPGYTGAEEFTNRYMRMNLPGAQFPFAAMQAIPYGLGGMGSQEANFGINDYTGVASMPLLQRWRELSKTAETAKQIVDLIWTDISTSAVAGSKGVLGRGNGGVDGAQIRVEVAPVRRRIKYRLPFAVPAFLLAAVLLVITVGGLVITWLTAGGLEQVRVALRQASTGRLVTAVLDPAASDLRMETAEWAGKNGAKEIDLGGTHPLLVTGAGEWVKVEGKEGNEHGQIS